MTKPLYACGFRFTRTFGKVFAIGILFLCILDASLSMRHIGDDFSVRYNEVECLKSGIDPFDVWSGKIRHDPYYSFHGQAESGQTKRVHAYPPWEYTFFLPLTLFPKKVASALFGIIQTLSILFAGGLIFRWGRSLRGRKEDGLFVTACGMALGASVGFAFWFRQYGITNLALLLAMFGFLHHHRQIPAGVCWALIMAKPQVGIPLFVPLAVGRQWKTIITAIAVCCIAAIPPALLCHSSPATMISEIRTAGGNVLAGTSILPKPLFALLARAVHPAFPPLASAAIGMSLCAWLSVRLRSAKSWLVRFLPALVCATGWTYLQVHDKTLFLFPQATAAMLFLSERRSVRRGALLGLILLGMSSIGACVHVHQTGWFHDFVWHLPSGLPSQLAYATYIAGSFLQFFGTCLFLHSYSNELSELGFPVRETSSEHIYEG